MRETSVTTLNKEAVLNGFYVRTVDVHGDYSTVQRHEYVGASMDMWTCKVGAHSGALNGAVRNIVDYGVICVLSA